MGNVWKSWGIILDAWFLRAVKPQPQGRLLDSWQVPQRGARTTAPRRLLVHFYCLISAKSSKVRNRCDKTANQGAAETTVYADHAVSM